VIKVIKESTMQLDVGGVPSKVFSRPDTGNGDVFVLPAESGRYNGVLVLQAVGLAGVGTITALVVSLDVSLDKGVTYQEFLAAVNLQTGPKQLDVRGLGGGALLRLRSTTYTLGTATGVDVYAIAG
jgi:hypothetical protein